MKHRKPLLMPVLITALALVLGIAAAAAAPTGFSPEIQITYPDADTMQVTIDAHSTDILAEHTPTLLLPCDFAEAYVTFDGQTIASTLANGEISFAPAAGGTYTVHAGTDPNAPKPSPEPSPEPDPEPSPEPVVNPFEDVDEADWYYEAVLWALEKGVTNGISATEFGADDPCTRAQAVTFLWRAAASPAAQKDVTFRDVSADAYYYDAVTWALEQEITAGYSPSAFAPDDTCTRAQIVTFLWRAAGSPAVQKELTFRDVPADAYYYDAVVWAAENGITAGYSSTIFAPNDTCTRAQIVTFLWRAMN